MSVNGHKAIMRQLKAHQTKTVRGLRKGLLKGGGLLQKKSMKIVPVDKDVLRPSAFTRIFGTGFKSHVEVGYESNYAIYVHEMTENRHKPGKSAKFLEKPFRENIDDIKKTIRAGMEGRL